MRAQAGDRLSKGSISPLFIHQIVQRQRTLLAVNVLQQLAGNHLRRRDRGHMWGDDHLRMQPERVILRQGFNGEDIQYRARQPAAIQRLQNIVIHHMFAAPAVDEYRACGKPIEQRPGENTASLFGERQNVDQRIQLSKNSPACASP